MHMHISFIFEHRKVELQFLAFEIDIFVFALTFLDITIFQIFLKHYFLISKFKIWNLTIFIDLFIIIFDKLEPFSI